METNGFHVFVLKWFGREFMVYSLGRIKQERTYFLYSYLKCTMARTPHSRFNCNDGCPVELALSVIGQKYKGAILYRLFADKVLRFNEIRRLFPEVSPRTLTNQLRALEADGIIVRTVYPEVPPKVEYALSDYGRTLEHIIAGLKAWGEGHKKQQLFTDVRPQNEAEWSDGDE